jgi:hypothetical protein
LALQRVKNPDTPGRATNIFFLPTDVLAIYFNMLSLMSQVVGLAQPLLVDMNAV